MKYSQFPYKRIDIKKHNFEVEKMILDFKSALSSKNQILIIKKYQKLQKEYQTFSSIAHLNFAKNTKDNSAIEENNFYDEIGPEIAEIDNKFTKEIYFLSQERIRR